MRDLAGVVQREEAQIGVLISPSSDLSEATGRRSDSAGCFETTLCWSRYPRLRQQAETTVIASASAICTSVHPPSDRTPFFGPLMMRVLVGLLSSNGGSTRWPPGLPDSPGLKPRPVTPPLLVALSLL